jgi:Icc-related predicted phosphoesterase
MRFRSRKAGRRDGETRLRLYYASDIHGSDLLWRKFLNSAAHYKAQVLIMGGDLTGKGLVPIVKEDGQYVATVIGERRVAKSDSDLEDLLKAIRQNGMYPVRVTTEDLTRLRSDRSFLAATFDKAIVDEVERWMHLADSRLADQDVEMFVMAGNDDPWEIDAALGVANSVLPCDDRVVRADRYELLSLGYSNRTPWDSPRELDEDDLYARLRKLADQLEDPASTIMNIHVPPFASGLDTATELDDELRPVLVGGQPKPKPVGSTAVRQILEEVQPVLALHGHVHESKGVATIGRTIAINPGSDYTSGRLDGCICELVDDNVALHHLTSG